MATETERIVRLLEKTFDKHPWYGSSIMEVLDMDPAIAIKRIGNGHTIIELVRHMTSWRMFATKRLQGDDAFEITEEMNFPKTGTWEEALMNLRNSQSDLVGAAKNFPEGRYGELVPSKSQKYTYYTLLHGVLHHDIYHLGQIAYIRKSVS
jgi:uncharacterized damage-inducible protein DinB